MPARPRATTALGGGDAEVLDVDGGVEVVVSGVTQDEGHGVEARVDGGQEREASAVGSGNYAVEFGAA